MDGFGIGFFIFVIIMIAIGNIIKYNSKSNQSPADSNESIIDPSTGAPRAYGRGATNDSFNHSDPFND